MTPYNAYWRTDRQFKNTGNLWTEEEKAQLRRMFLAGDKIDTICVIMERPPDGVRAKLVSARLIVGDAPTVGNRYKPDYWVNPRLEAERKVIPDPFPIMGEWRSGVYPGQNLQTIPRKSGLLSGAYMRWNPEEWLTTVEWSNGYPLEKIEPLAPLNLFERLRSNIPTKENTMKNIVEITFIDGLDASTLTDTQIFQKIAKLEKDMAGWKLIENRPAKLTKAIAALQLDIDKLVAYVDGR